MGLFSTPDPPSPPDPYATARAQGAANVETAQETARLNRLNEITPWGNLEYLPTPDPNVPWARRVTLNETDQQALQRDRELDLALTNLATGTIASIQPTFGTRFDIPGAPPSYQGPAGEMPVANEAVRNQVTDALMQRMDPYLQRDEERLRTRLTQAGHTIGDEGYNRAIDETSRARNDARLAAIGQGGGEMARLFGLEMAGRSQAEQEAARQFTNDLSSRQQLAQEMSLERTQPINEIAALVGTAGPINVPTFAPTPQVEIAPPDLTGAVYGSYGGEMNAYNQQLRNQQAGMGGLFGLAGSVAGALPWGSWF